MEEGPRYVFGAEMQRIKIASEQFFLLYTSFSAEAARTDQKRWSMGPKVQQFIHIFEDMVDDHLNPYYFSGWTDESFMMHIAKMAANADRRQASKTMLIGWFA